MSDEFEFDTISSGDWVKMSEHVGEWVLIRVIETTKRHDQFSDSEQTVLRADIVFDLLGEGHLFDYDQLNSDNYVAPKCVGKKLVVGYINQGVPKQKGWKGATYLEQPDNADMQRAVAKARQILEAEKAAKAEAKARPAAPSAKAVRPEESELEDLLQGF